MNLGGAVLGGLTGALGGGWAGAGLGAASGSGLLGQGLAGLGGSGIIGKILPSLIAQQLSSHQPSDVGQSSFTMPSQGGQFSMPTVSNAQYGAGSPSYQNALIQALAQYQR